MLKTGNHWDTIERGYIGSIERVLDGLKIGVLAYNEGDKRQQTYK